MQWTVFCRVIDNFGDIGFAWRLAADLGARGEDVRLAVDDKSALAWMAPGGAARVQVAAWDAAGLAEADVLVETFGCGLPETTLAGLVASADPPTCVNVEHLSAETYVERSHRLASPRFGAQGRPIPTWFFYPGFNDRTGGLLREPGLPERRLRFAGRRWLASRGIARRSDERCVSLFCYRNPALAALLEALAEAPTLLLLAPGPSADQAAELLGPTLTRGALRALRLPMLAQVEFDHLLWSCDLNFVRGEDSLVRALWAGTPFVWQLYPQEGGAHAAKLEAFLGFFLGGAGIGLEPSLRLFFAAWNGLAADPFAAASAAWPSGPAWAAHCRSRRDRLAAQPDLTTCLLDFVASRR